jgi:2-amino-4-hydroxy-6-hydroxymethyldihydropteridine diphosphokinase
MVKDANSNIAYIGFGSNINDRLTFIRKAANEIEQHNNCKIIKFSSVYETKPFGETDQPDFLNAVAKTTTSLPVLELFRFLKDIEKKLGRKETYKWGPREIDLDLLFYNDIVFSDENLTVPHPGIPQRDFVLIPLIEIEPALFHPVLKQKISDIYIPESKRNIIRVFNQEII